MLVRYLNDDGTHGYEEIDFRETMPAAGNVTVSQSCRDGVMESGC
jgi:gamma-glutamyltranspeptidase/glutathione hydrolase